MYQPETDTHSNPLDIVTLDDFVDAGIRCELSASRTFTQVCALGIYVDVFTFYNKWRERKQVWRRRYAA